MNMNTRSNFRRSRFPLSGCTVVLLSASVLAWLASATTSSARINETYDQIRARYGYAVHVDFQPQANYPLYIFEKDGLTIGVRFLDGKSAQEIYTTSGANTDFAAADVLAANAQGYSWSPLTVGQSTSYERADGAATAEYTSPPEASNAPAVLVVQTSAFNQLFNSSDLGF